jgi:DNA-directed RNA polymerase subunit K/omega
MSSSHDSHSSGGHAEEDKIDFKKVITVGVVSLVIFALASWWAISILHSETAILSKRGQRHVPAEIGSAEIGIVDQVPFEGDARLAHWRAERAEQLNGYGWVDRPRGIIHIPVDRAMDEIVAGAVPPKSVSGAEDAAPGAAR